MLASYNKQIIRGQSKLSIKGQGRFNMFIEIIPDIKNITERYGVRFQKDPFDHHSENTEAEIKARYDDYKLSCIMSDNSISPKISGMFAITLTDDNQSRKKTKIYEFMEPYTGDLNCLPQESKEFFAGAIETQLLWLFSQVIHINWFCVYIKADNVVYRIDNNEITVKLVDWDNRFVLVTKN